MSAEALREEGPSRRRPGSFAWLLLACLASRAVGFWRPCLSDDEAIYAVVAREILSGRVLYRDVVDHKPPLIYLTYAATQAVGGPVGGMRLLHLLTALVVLATACLVGRVARLAGGTAREGFAAALLYALFSTTLFAFDALAANCELYMMLPLVGSVVCVLAGARRDLSLPRLVLAGVLAGVAILYKYQAGIQLPLYAVYIGVLGGRRPVRVLAGWAALAGGVAIVVGAAAAVLAHVGALGAAWFWFKFNFSYIREGLRPSEVLARALVRVSYGVGPALFLWVLGVGAAVRAFWDPGPSGAPRDPARPDRFVAAWLVASAVAVTAGGRFFGHYFHQVTAPLAVLAAPVAARLWTTRRAWVAAAVGVPAAVFFLVGFGQGRVLAAAGAAEPDYGALAAYIDAHSDLDDGLAVWGNAPVLYFQAGRPLGSRFVFSNYLTGMSPATRTQTDPRADSAANVVAESWDMFEADLEARKPRLFVDTSPGNLAAYGKFPPARYPRLEAILARDYAPIAEVGGARVLARRAP
jgi:4-amino-4-deoxy-L-arabinose transferase-like glycosyltransferase